VFSFGHCRYGFIEIRTLQYISIDWDLAAYYMYFDEDQVNGRAGGRAGGGLGEALFAMMAVLPCCVRYSVQFG
jgi:hypothetical protein